MNILLTETTRRKVSRVFGTWRERAIYYSVIRDVEDTTEATKAINKHLQPHWRWYNFTATTLDDNALEARLAELRANPRCRPATRWHYIGHARHLPGVRTACEEQK